MKEKLLPFLLGATLSGGAAITANVTAASGDAIYEIGGERQCITAAQAACYADCAIADGTWTGTRTNMLLVKAYRQPNCDIGKNFAAAVRGKVSAPLANVPEGSVLHGIVP